MLKMTIKTANLTLALIVLTSFSEAQVSDINIVNKLLGKNYLEISQTLDTLGVWYYYHGDENCSLTIETNGIAKCFYFHYYYTNQNFGKIYKIVINYRHDSRSQIEELKKIKKLGNVEVGKFSTDVVFKL